MTLTPEQAAAALAAAEAAAKAAELNKQMLADLERMRQIGEASKADRDGAA